MTCYFGRQSKYHVVMDLSWTEVDHTDRYRGQGANPCAIMYDSHPTNTDCQYKDYINPSFPDLWYYIRDISTQIEGWSACTTSTRNLLMQTVRGYFFVRASQCLVPAHKHCLMPAHKKTRIGTDWCYHCSRWSIEYDLNTGIPYWS